MDKKYIIKHWKISPIIGIGYWKDIYKPKDHGFLGVSHNIILPFIRIQFGQVTRCD